MSFISGGGSGSAAPAGGDAQFAAASSNLTLGAAPTDIPGARLTLNRVGLYLISAVFDFTLTGAGDTGSTLAGSLVANGTTQASVASFCTDVVSATSPRATVAQQWLFQATTSGQVMQLQAAKSAGSGASQVRNRHTSISAIWIKP